MGKYPRCQFCNTSIAEGSILRRRDKIHEDLYLCDDCRRLLAAWIEDALPETMRSVMNRAEEPLCEELDYFSWKEGQE